MVAVPERLTWFLPCKDIQTVQSTPASRWFDNGLQVGQPSRHDGALRYLPLANASAAALSETGTNRAWGTCDPW